MPSGRGDLKRPLCFVLMPYGQKRAVSGTLVDFEAVHAKPVRPAILDAKLRLIRADEGQDRDRLEAVRGRAEAGKAEDPSRILEIENTLLKKAAP